MHWDFGKKVDESLLEKLTTFRTAIQQYKDQPGSAGLDDSIVMCVFGEWFTGTIQIALAAQSQWDDNFWRHHRVG